VTKKSHSWRVACAIGTVAVALLVGSDPNAFFFDGSLASRAEAVVGMPLTPVSVAGVARRTTRRAIRRSAIYVNTLPGGCVKTTIYGPVLYQCGATYYQPYGPQYVVVYID